MTTKINTSQIADGAITSAKINSSVQLGGPTITAIAYPGDDTAADTAGGQTITLTGTGFKTGASVIINGTTASVVTFVSNTSITFTAPAQSAGSYVLYLVNTDGGTAIAVPGIQYSGTPTWSTAAGSLATYTETVAISNTVTATGDAPITYSLYSGSLPNGATLNTSSGLISGSSPLANNATTYNFTIRATDAQNQDTDRAFSITINPDVVTWSSPANNITYSVNKDAAISNVTLSATSASGQTIVYTANSLPTGLTLSGNTISGTPTVVASNNTLVTATANNTNKSAVQIINWVVSVAADTYFPRVGLLLSGDTPANTFVTDASTNNFAITVNGDTKPNNFNPYTPGYYSVQLSGSNYLTSASSNEFIASGNGFTVETWVYYTSISSYSFILASTTGTNSYNPYWFIGSTPGANWRVSWGNASAVDTGVAIKLNCWNHVAMVMTSAGAGTLYVNGSSVATATGIGLDGSATAVAIGHGGGSLAGSYLVTGYISNVRYVKNSSVYTGAFTPSTTPLTAITGTSLLTCQSNRFIDVSTNALAITATSSPQISGFIPYTPSSSYSTYGSGYFSGSGSLTAASNTAFSLTGDFTIECWVYLTTATGTKTIYTNRTSGGNASGLAWVTQSGSQAMSIYTAGGFSLTSSISIPLNAWTHVALTRSGSTMTQWVNGASGGTVTNSSSFTDAQCYIGVNNSSGEYWPGYITDFRIVKGSAVYTTTFTPPTSPLTAVSGTSLLTLQNNQPNNNNIFVDNSTNNALITRTGNATQGSFSPYAGAWSNYFDGTGDYLSIAANAAFGFGTGDWTIECWIYMTSMSHYNTIFDTRVGSGTQSGSFSIGIFSGDGTGTLQLFSGGAFYNPSNTFSSNTWYHIAVVKNSGVTKLYVNGTGASTSYSDSRNYGSSQPVQIGNDDASNYFQGYISNMRVVKGTAVYTTNFTSPSAPLTQITNTSLLTCQSNRLIDNSIINSTIVKNGDTTVQKFSPFTMQTAIVPTSYSAYFDGSGDYLTTPVFGAGAGSGLFTTGATFTVEAWLYQTAYVNTSGYVNTIIGDLTPTVTTALWWAIGTDSTNAPVFRWYDGSVKTCTGTVALSTNTWNHVAFVCTSGTLSIYVNGTSQSVTGTTTISTPAGNQSSLVIGADRGYYVTGYISNLRVVKNVAAYTGNFTTPTSPLAATQSSGTNISAITGTQTALLTLQSTTFIDNSTNAFTITANGDSKPTIQNPFGYTNPSATSYTTSSLGGSMYLDGSGDYVYGSVASPGTGDYSIEAWVYFTGAPKGVVQLTTSLAPSSYSGIGFGIEPNTSYFSYFHGGYTTPNSPYYTALQNTWYHLAQTRQSGTIRFFINGILVSSVSDTTNYTGNYYCKLGGVYDNTFLMTGYMSDFRYVLGQALYTSSFVPPAAPLTAIKNSVFLLNGTGAGIYDSSMINEFETVADTKISSSIKKYGNGSIYFDGTGDYLTTVTSPNLQLGTGDFTIECWSYLTSRVNGYPAIFSNYNSFTTGALALFAGHGSATTTAYQVAMNGSFPAIQGGTISYNTWVHLAVVRSGSTVTLYVGGTSVGTASSSAALNGVGSIFHIGTTGDDLSGGCIQGYLSDFRVTKGYARYTGNFTPPTSSLLTK